MEAEILRKRKRILGEEHPHTVPAMGNLAITLGAQGKHKEAGVMQKEVPEKRRRILEEEHPHTISTTNSLATTISG